MARTDHPGGLHPVRRLPTGQRLGRTVRGLCPAGIGGHPGAAVHQWRTVIGTAIMSFRHFGDGYAVLLLSLWIGIGFIFQGVSAIAAAIGDSNLPGRGWSVVLGVISVIAGLVVLAWP